MTAEPRNPKLLRRLLDKAMEPYVRRLREDTYGWVQGVNEAVQGSISVLHSDLGRVHAELEEVHGRMKRVERDSERGAAISRHLFDAEVENRRRLYAVRETDEYELAYSEAEPLVTIVVPTFSSFDTLREKALPSILAQSHSELEVIVVGDAAAAGAADVVAGLGDPRVRFVNRTVRGPYPEEPSKRWYVIGTGAINDGMALARGRWIGVLGDDDAYRPDHVRLLLEAARDGRLEHVYGQQVVRFEQGETLTLGEFPPRLGQWGLQAGLTHSALRFFELEFSDAIYREPNDWSVCRRMMRAGVRIGMVDEVVVDKYESRRGSPEEWRQGPVPTVE